MFLLLVLIIADSLSIEIPEITESIERVSVEHIEIDGTRIDGLTP